MDLEISSFFLIPLDYTSNFASPQSDYHFRITNLFSNMGRPSDHWQGFAVLRSDSEKYKRIQLLLSSANFEYLKNTR